MCIALRRQQSHHSAAFLSHRSIASSLKKLRRACATWQSLQLPTLKRKAHRRRGAWHGDTGLTTHNGMWEYETLPCTLTAQLGAAARDCALFTPSSCRKASFFIVVPLCNDKECFCPPAEQKISRVTFDSSAVVARFHVLGPACLTRRVAARVPPFRSLAAGAFYSNPRCT